MIRRRVFTVIALVAALITTAGSRTQLLADDENEGKSLRGSWDITISNVPVPPFNAPFRILRTVTEDGVIDAYAFPSFVPAWTPGLVNSAGHGVSKRLGARKYSVFVEYFQIDSNSFFSAVNTIGKVKETITLSPDGDSYTSTFDTEISLPDGTVLFHNPGSTTAKRIK